MVMMIAKKSSDNPLWLSIACEELRVFGIFEKVTEKIEELADDILGWVIPVVVRKTSGEVYTLKTPGSNLTRKGIIAWGQTPFRVNGDPGISQSDPIICQFCGKLTDFRVILDPEWSLAPMDSFRVRFDPSVLECKLFLKAIYVSIQYKEERST